MNTRPLRTLARPYIVTSGKGFRLSTRPTKGAHHEEHAKKYLKKGVKVLSGLQEKLYAQDRWSVLLIFQAMDAAGKDGTIEHVMSGVNPQGCEVHSFKAPSAEELDHDFMWRTTCRLPERGRIGIFNRSYYEEVLVARVHPEILGRQKIPAEFKTKKVWKERFEDINAFERYLARNGTLIRKFFLHLSKGEQKRRFLSRLDEPSKNWKFSLADAKERGFWKDYMEAYEDVIRHTAAPHAPWIVVPADDKKYARAIVAAAIVDAMSRLQLAFPAVDAKQRVELRRARRILEGEGRR